MTYPYTCKLCPTYHGTDFFDYVDHKVHSCYAVEISFFQRIIQFFKK